MYNIGIIGLGNIGSAFYSGLRKSNFSQNLIYICDKSLDDKEINQYDKKQILEKPRLVFEKVELVFLCIRSDQVYSFLAKYSPIITNDHRLVLMSAGIKLVKARKVFKPRVQRNVIRVVSNINLASCSAYTFVYKDKKVSLSVYEEVVSIFKKLGVVEKVHSEEKLDTHSLLSGTSPALLAFFLESLVDAGIEIGVKNKEASRIIKNIIASSIITMEQEGINSHVLMKRVSTPKGLVARALDEVSKTDFKWAVNSWFNNILININRK